MFSTTIFLYLFKTKIMWEYKRINYRFKIFNELIEKLNNEGQQGWEVVYYEETKPEQYGYEYETNVLYKRLIKLSTCTSNENS